MPEMKPEDVVPATLEEFVLLDEIARLRATAEEDAATRIARLTAERDEARKLAAIHERGREEIASRLVEFEAGRIAAQQERDRLRAALVKVRAHTSYTFHGSTADLIALVNGLLASIERITVAALEGRQ